MKASDVIKNFNYHIKSINPELLNKAQVVAAEAQFSINDISSRAMGCHCECLGMNAENSIAACSGKAPPYSDDYLKIMQKWGLLDEKGNVLI